MPFVIIYKILRNFLDTSSKKIWVGELTKTAFRVIICMYLFLLGTYNRIEEHFRSVTESGVVRPPCNAGTETVKGENCRRSSLDKGSIWDAYQTGSVLSPGSAGWGAICVYYNSEVGVTAGMIGTSP